MNKKEIFGRLEMIIKSFQLYMKQKIIKKSIKLELLIKKIKQNICLKKKKLLKN
jgi:hypothetical protein